MIKSKPIIFPSVEIVEYGALDEDAKGHIAGALRVNGVEFHAPLDSQIEIVSGPDQLTRVTATFFVSNVSIHREERP